MSRELGLKLINLEPAEKAGHTEYLSNPDFLEYLTGSRESDNIGMDPQVFDKLDLDFRWFTWGPELKGRTTSMGMAKCDEDDIRSRDLHKGFSKVEEILELDPVREYGLAGESEANKYKYEYEQLCWQYPKAVIPVGTYRSVISFCIDIFGWDLFLTAIATDADKVGKILGGIGEVIMSHIKAMTCFDFDCFLTHDDIVWTSGPFTHPDWYRKYVFPVYEEYWIHIHSLGKKVLYCCDGNFNEFIDDAAKAGADGFIFEPTTNLQYICKKYGKTHVIIGNADCRIVTNGTKNDIVKEIDRCLDLGKSYPGYFFAFGNHLPADVPLEKLIFALEYFEKKGNFINKFLKIAF